MLNPQFSIQVRDVHKEFFWKHKSHLSQGHIQRQTTIHTCDWLDNFRVPNLPGLTRDGTY